MAAPGTGMMRAAETPTGGRKERLRTTRAALDQRRKVFKAKLPRPCLNVRFRRDAEQIRIGHSAKL
jgi:hypothetical protein